MRRVRSWVLWGLAVYGLWYYFAPISHPSGVLIPQDPDQTLYTTAQPSFPLRGWTLTPLALYTIEARVLSIETYGGDPPGDLAPYDLALGWGRMSDTSVLERLDISQSNRFYHWHYWGQPPIPAQEIITHSANVHIIPADNSVLEKLKSLRKGSLIHMTGSLVEARHPRGVTPWRSSLTRDDTGDGACEIMYVTSLVDK